MPITKFEKNKYAEIMDSIDEFIPNNYKAQVKEILAIKGIQKTDLRIYKARNQRAIDLDIAYALQDIARPIMKKFQDSNNDQLAQQYGMTR